MRLRAAILSFLPGVAHIDLHRAGRGLAFFTAFAVALNTALLAPFLSADPRLRAAAGGAAASLWIFALADALRIAGRPPEARTP